MPTAVRLTLGVALLLNVIGVGLLLGPVRGFPQSARDTLLAVAWLSGAAACIHYERWRVGLGAPASPLRGAAALLGMAAVALLAWTAMR